MIKCSRRCMLLAVTICLVFSSLQTAIAEEYFNKRYEWDYKETHWNADLPIPESLYYSYQKVSVSDRTKYGVAGYDFLVTTKDYYVRQIANELHEAAIEKGYEAYDEVSFVLAFVQSLPYTSDSVTSGYDEYPRFPIETLVDDGGDCEDTSILFATIILLLNYSAVFISPPDHLAVGVLGTELSGYYYTFEDRTYYYCETTGEDWKIGDIPDDFKDTTVSIYSIHTGSQYTPDQDFSLLLIFLLSLAIIISIWYSFRRHVRKDKDSIKRGLHACQNASASIIIFLVDCWLNSNWKDS